MRFLATNFAEAWLIEPDPVGDQRGSFARTFCEREFAEMGLENRFVQHSVEKPVHYAGCTFKDRRTKR